MHLPEARAQRGAEVMCVHATQGDTFECPCARDLCSVTCGVCGEVNDKPPENVFRVGDPRKYSDLLYLPGFERVNPETGGSK